MKFDWTLWWLFLVTETTLSFVPGPAVLFVVAQGLGRGLRAAVAANLGILTGNFIYFVLCAVGLLALVAAWPRAFAVLRWLGVVYLVWIGLSSILGRHTALKAQADRAAEPFARTWLRATLLQLSNPKAIIFFSALLPQFVNPHLPLVPQMALLTVTSVGTEFWILLGYGALAGRAARWAAEPATAAWMDRGAGALLIGAALLTAIA